MRKIKAEFKWVRGSSQKYRRVMNLLRGKSVDFALRELKFMPHKSARVIYKLIKSAAANAENNFKLDPATLIVSEIHADVAGMHKRIRARARGRAFSIMKRVSHVSVFVSSKEEK